MSKKLSKKEIDKFIEILKKAESVSINYGPSVPDMVEFYDDGHEGDCLVHCVAAVHFSIR